VDKKGRPKVVYHGTISPVEFDAFDWGPGALTPDDYGEVDYSGWSVDTSAAMGPHFAEDFKVAAMVAGFVPGQSWLHHRHGSKFGRVIPVYLRVAKPKRYMVEERLTKALWGGSSETLYGVHEDYLFDASKFKSEASYNESAFVELKRYGDDSAIADAAMELGSALVDKLRKQGHDGVSYKNDVEGGKGWSWIVFDQRQIKSAIGNSGAFSPGDPSILNPGRRRR
jgi:hypothetical protein